MAFVGNFMCTSFKVELMQAVHNFNLSGGSTFKLALYTDLQAGNDNMGGDGTNMDASVTNYSASASNEVANGNGYTTGGAELTRVNPTETGTTAFADFEDLTFASSTITARGCVIYNDSASGDPSVVVLDFGSDKTSTSGDFTVVFPAADETNAIIRIA